MGMYYEPKTDSIILKAVDPEDMLAASKIIKNPKSEVYENWMESDFRRLNIHFDIQALQDAYHKAINDIGFSGEMVNCISLTHCEKESSAPRGIFWMMNENYEEIQVERYVNEDAYKIFEPLLMDSYFKNVYDILGCSKNR